MELPKRKPTRLRQYDYSTQGKYFLTVCVKEKQCLLGEIKGEPREMILSEKGQILDRHIKSLGDKYEDIGIEKYAIMPNHLHLLINIDVNGVSSTPQNNKLSMFVSLLKRYCNMDYGENIWQKSFYDHIIRDEEDYQTRWNYIDTNVQRWKNE